MQQALRQVSCAILIGSCGRLILQQRDDVPDIIFPGLVSLFGGHREADETAWECITRELSEEIGVTFSAAQLEPFMQFRTAFAAPGERELDVSIYFAAGIDVRALHVSEGSLLLAAVSDLPRHMPRMTPLTAYALTEFLHGRQLPAKMQQAVRALQGASPEEDQSQQ